MRAYQQLETCSAPDRDLGLLPACLSVHKVAYNHNDTLIQPGLSHGAQPVARPDMKCKWGIGDVNREMPASQSDIVINSFTFVLRATGRKRHKDT